MTHGYWALVADEDTFRLYADVPAALPVGDRVLLIGPGPVLAGVGRATAGGTVRTERVLDEPIPVDLDLAAGTRPLDEPTFTAIESQLPAPAVRRDWLVTLALPIEAGTPAEAVREFWSYVRDLGPRELPAFVSPSGDELAMQAYVLGVESNQDPEED